VTASRWRRSRSVALLGGRSALAATAFRLTLDPIRSVRLAAVTSSAACALSAQGRAGRSVGAMPVPGSKQESDVGIAMHLSCSTAAFSGGLPMVDRSDSAAVANRPLLCWDDGSERVMGRSESSEAPHVNPFAPVSHVDVLVRWHMLAPHDRGEKGHGHNLAGERPDYSYRRPLR
jgi:hypothetical protein